jgi:DUF4097 and DUF4098 domain-containing protein YvlB
MPGRISRFARELNGVCKNSRREHLFNKGYETAGRHRIRFDAVRSDTYISFQRFWGIAMKTYMQSFLTAALWMGLTIIAYPQAPDADHFTIPLSDPSRTATVNVKILAGSISVKGYDGNEVIVDAKYGERTRSRERPDVDTTGLQRIATTGMVIEEEDNVIDIRTGSMMYPSDITLQVPRHTMLVLKKVNKGDITVEQVRGEIEVNNINGNVNLNQVSGSVVAHALNGNVKVSLVDIEPDAPMSFSSLNGDIDVSFPADLKADVSMSTAHGEIFSGFDVKIDETRGRIPVDDSSEEEGKVRIDGSIRGRINGGGAEMQFKAFNGNIYIRKLSK